LCQDQILQQLLFFMRTAAIGRLHAVADAIAMLDMLCSLSIHASTCMKRQNNQNHLGVAIPELFENDFQDEEEDHEQAHDGIFLEDFKSISILVHNNNTKNQNYENSRQNSNQQQLQTFFNSSSFIQNPSQKMKIASQLAQRNFYLPPLLSKQKQQKQDEIISSSSKNHDGRRLLTIINGPNASGKSSLLRDVCHLCIVAHLGGLLPCSQARIPLLDNIFYRDSATEASPSAAGNFSSRKFLSFSRFTHDLRETAKLLKNVAGVSELFSSLPSQNENGKQNEDEEQQKINSPSQNKNNNHRKNKKSTLVLIDELARGTSTREGAAVVSSVATYLANLNNKNEENNKKIFTILATHHISVAQNLPKLFPDLITSCQMDVELVSLNNKNHQNNNNCFNLEATFGVKPGACSIPQYGILLAQTTNNMPRHVIDCALKIHEKIEKNKIKSQQETGAKERFSEI
jgi:DNA mismatch repair ATPase MutS